MAISCDFHTFLTGFHWFSLVFIVFYCISCWLFNGFMGF